jgi:hypothetical protein
MLNLSTFIGLYSPYGFRELAPADHDCVSSSKMWFPPQSVNIQINSPHLQLTGLFHRLEFA